MTESPVRRIIVAIPTFEDAQLINAVRERLDPTSKHVPPHIVLVFPFQSEIPGDQLAAHIRQALSGVTSFPIVLQGITGFADRFLLMNVKVGNDELIFAHDKLYCGLLAQYFQPRYTFFPHLGVGFVAQTDEFMNVVHALANSKQEVTGIVKTVAVQRVFENKPPEIEFQYELEDDH